jgi:glycosyltransferase involved in cell wall biosynthesis
VEEFGITAVEAQAAGRPVIAAAAGGALETVIDGQTGRLAKLDDIDSFADAIRSIEQLDFDPAHAVRNAQRFSVAAFERRLSGYVSEVMAGGTGRGTPGSLSRRLSARAASRVARSAAGAGRKPSGARRP